MSEQPARTIGIQLSPEAEAQIAEFTRLLSLLPKDVAYGFFDQLLGLLDGACLGVVIPDDSIAPIAGNQVLGLRIGGYEELIAAARSALEN